MNPKQPVYVISKGRWKARTTSKALEKRGIPYRLVIEPQELENYAEFVDRDKILTLPFSNLGQGSIPARNWVWDHAKANGSQWHWILDDNISSFYRLNKNKREHCMDGSGFAIIEEFASRYENLAIAGKNYMNFAAHKTTSKPVKFNTRVYSCLLIRNDISYRWRGRYNEDTDLCLRVLKDGWCTALFNAFLADKVATMTMRGGNTDELYKDDGRLQMAKSLKRQHPDLVEIKRRWGRWQHVVNYKPFKTNKLVKKPGVKIEPGVNEFGLQLVDIK